MCQFDDPRSALRGANPFGHVQIDAFHTVGLGDSTEGVNEDTNEDACADGEQLGSSLIPRAQVGRAGYICWRTPLCQMR